MIDRAAFDAAAARSAGVAADIADRPVMRMLEQTFQGEDADLLADKAERLLGGEDWLNELLAPLTAQLAVEPLFEPPFAVQRDASRFSVVLFDRPAVTITATILSADALALAGPARTVAVAGRISVVRYIRAGGAQRRLWKAEPAGTDFRAAVARPCRALPAQALRDGMVIRLDGRTHGQAVDGATADLFTVTATIRPGATAYAREYDVATGRLLRCAMLEERPARTQMLLAYLRLAGRRDAGACFAAATYDPAFFVRWPAMREWLALDGAAALPRLRAMAQNDPHDEVRGAAYATSAMIAARAGAMPCRA